MAHHGTPSGRDTVAREVQRPHWWVFGSNGFVGGGIVAELRGRGVEPARARALRLTTAARDTAGVVADAEASASLEDLAARIPAGAVVVNAAGLAAPDSSDDDALYGANALWPSVLALACAEAGAARLVHLSSAAVQGYRPVLDESWDVSPFSPYSRSKALGEAALRALQPRLPEGMLSIVRATSVQGAGRRTTASFARVASSPLASVAGAGDAPSPVSSLPALSQFVVDVGLRRPDQTVLLQPWEGLSVRGALAAAGGREPARVPAWLCRAAVRTGFAVSKVAGESLHGPVRRAEVMWFGQAQEAGWAEANGVLPTPRAEQVLRQAAPGSGEG